MSLNIDMKMIRPVNVAGFSLIFDMNSWTLLQSCNVVNPGKISTRIPLAHPLCRYAADPRERASEEDAELVLGAGVDQV